MINNLLNRHWSLQGRQSDQQPDKTQKNVLEAFTLIEMLVVLLIISVLILLFVPNLSKQKATVNEKGDQAIVKVVDTQKELYILENNVTEATPETLKNAGYITQEQLQKYNQITKK